VQSNVRRPPSFGGISLCLAVLCASCSRAGGERVAERTAPTAVAPAEAGPPLAVEVLQPPPNSMALPRAYAKSTWNPPGLALAAGQDPSTDHPAGTVYVGERAGMAWAPFTVTEFDLTSGRPLRHAAVPVSPDDEALAMVRGGDRLHLVGWVPEQGSYQYFQLGPSLQIVARSPVKGMDGGAPNALASDGTVTVIVARHSTFDGATEYASCFVATFDAAGKPISSRPLELPGEEPASALLEGNAAIAGGNVYVLQAFRGLSFRIWRLTPDLREVAQRRLTAGSGAPNRSGPWRGQLRLEGDHLVASTDLESFQISLDLSQVAPMEGHSSGVHGYHRAGCEDDVVLGPVNASLCGRAVDGGALEYFVAWDREDPPGFAVQPLDASVEAFPFR
jgi:hypothetical protein